MTEPDKAWSIYWEEPGLMRRGLDTVFAPTSERAAELIVEWHPERTVLWVTRIPYEQPTE